MNTLASILFGAHSTGSSTELYHNTVTQSDSEIVSPSPSSAPIPFFLWCLGGRWEGYLLEWNNDSMHLELKGFPPIELSQRLQLQYFVQGQESPMTQYQGLIQEIYTDSGPSAWEGSTHVVLISQVWNDCSHTVWPEIGILSAIRSEIYLLGLIPESSSHSIGDTEKPDRNFSVTRYSCRRKEDDLQDSDPAGKQPGIHSTRLSIPKANGQRISAFYDRPLEAKPHELPVVIIAPGYGETKRDYLTLSYYFASNGFQVVRYDHTNHVGESDGLHYDISLSSMKNDFQTVTRFVETTLPDPFIIGVAASLAARVAIKAEAEHSSLFLLVLLMGVVNVQRSAATVHQEDIFADCENDHYPDSANILGFNVGNKFLSDAITNKFVTLEETLQDAESGTSPVMMVSAGKDAWVAYDDLLSFRKALGLRLADWIVLPEALHRLQENPKIARDTYQHIVAQCQERVKKPTPCMIRHPNRWELGRQNRQEKLALQKHATIEVGHGFWQDYLGNFQSVGQCPDYVKLLDHVFQALGPVYPGQQFLDAGCGNGNAGLFFLKKLQSIFPHAPLFMKDSIQYVGIDVVPGALKRANETMMSVISELPQVYSSPHPMMSVTWSQVDLSCPLPFSDNRFDRIISNLVLGYLRDPFSVVKELYRVLAPGGRMVISNLKPNGDFSGIYESLVTNAACPEQRQEARDLLNNYGKIRQAEKEGQFCFFDRAQWKSILNTLDCTYAAIYPTFAGQAYLIVLEKSAAQGQALNPLNRHKTRKQSLNAELGILKKVA